MNVSDLKYKYSKRTIQMLTDVDPRLVILFSTYLALGKYDIGCTYGIRTEAEQKKLKAEGKSQTMNSKHLVKPETIETAEGSSVEINIGNAIDIVAYIDGKPVWDDKSVYAEIIADFKAIAAFFGWTDIINYGFDFKSFADWYHISIKKPNDGGVK
jgi:hypothetical protein